MATKTRVELIDRALEQLGILVEGQTPTADMRQKVDRLLDAHIRTLENLEITYVPNAGTAGGVSSAPTGGTIELEIFLPLADTLAWAAASGFNLAGDPSLKVLNDQAEMLLRRIGRPSRSRRMLQVDAATRSQARVSTGNFTRGT